MGTFSWLTADTRESISVTGAFGPHRQKTVFLLQPANRPPISEPDYDGYGDFGGTSAFEWLARENIAPNKLSSISHDEIIVAGISLDTGRLVRDVQTGQLYSIFTDMTVIAPGSVHHPIQWSEPVPGYDGLCANELVRSGRFSIEFPEKEFPLKFSFNENARYEDLPASPICPHQGGYYD